MAISYKPRPLNTYGLPDGRRPLRVLIAGAGIGGLTAALALREAGHFVQVFEARDQAQEPGAALHITPNAANLLQRLGIDLDGLGSVRCAGMRDYAPDDGKVRFSIDITRSSASFGNSLHLVHRQRLHTALKEKVLSTEGKGRAAELHLGTPIVAVDPREASLTTQDGSIHNGDIIIGADGVHSKTRAAIKDLKPFISGKSAFRFLIPASLLAQDPKSAIITEPKGYQCHWVQNDRRLISYPCQHNEFINFIAIHPSDESLPDQEATDSWKQGCSKEQMRRIYSSFNESVQAILDKVQDETLRVWPVWDMARLPSFAEENLALIGDAAHPFMPYQGQGAGLAIEDAVSLGVLLPLGTLKKEVSERLRLYNQCRYHRDTKIQGISRDVGKDISQLAAEGIKLDFPAFQAYMYNHDEYFNSQNVLKKHLEAKVSQLYRSPTSFGPCPGPQQPLNLPADHQTVQTLQKLNPESYTVHSIRFQTSRSCVKHLLPRGFSFFKSSTVVSATLSCTTRKSVAWLGGKALNQAALYLHDVVYTTQDGSATHGIYIPVQFSDIAEYVSAGREELGFPKTFATITTTDEDDRSVIQLSWQGVKFGEISLSNFGPEQTIITDANKPVKPAAANKGWGPPPPPPEQGLLVHRFIPSADGFTRPDADYALLYPFQKPAVDHGNLVKPTKQDAAVATLHFEGQTWAKLPTLHHMAQALAEVPVLGVESASVKRGLGSEEIGKPIRLD